MAPDGRSETMTPDLLQYLCDPVSKTPLLLHDPAYDASGRIVSGTLKSESGNAYPIREGIPRFVDGGAAPSVASFGNEWNHFNFVEFHSHWLVHTVANTFGSIEAFRDKLIVDAGGGSGAQTKWMLESGAKHVIMLELSHAVDDVVQRNLGSGRFSNYDVVQCSIDQPPIHSRSIDGIVICHNVIQHTKSVERTAHALFDLVASGGEFVFNCYPLNDQGVIRWIRFHLIYRPLRGLLSRLPFRGNLAYAKAIALWRLVPGLGLLLEKTNLCVQGDVPRVEGESTLERLRRRYRATVLNTFDCYGSHAYQHHKSDAEIRALVQSLQPDQDKILNRDRYFLRPAPIGCALRVFR